MENKKSKINEFGESLEINKEQEEIGVSIIDGRRCLHGLNMDQVDEMNELSMGLEEYKKFKEISKKSSESKKKLKKKE